MQEAKGGSAKSKVSQCKIQVTQIFYHLIIHVHMFGRTVIVGVSGCEQSSTAALFRAWASVAFFESELQNLSITSAVLRVGQNRINTPYMTVYLVISLPKNLYIHCIYYMVLANPSCIPYY
jgi:hypothetical protein